MTSHHWTRSFTVESNDIEFLIALLLEKENPLNTEILARALVERRITQEATLVQERFKNTRFYNPSHSYEIGQRLAFPVMDYATAVVVDVRTGENPEHDPFNVIKVEFDAEDDNALAGTTREFAVNLQTPHVLAEDSDAAGGSTGALNSTLSADEIMENMGDDIIYTVENALAESDQLVQIGNYWFPLDILIDVNEGHLHLVEAVLDINEGGPLLASQIISEIGGLDGSKAALQEFSLNYAMSEDDRFDEVGPAGEVLWYLRRLEPKEVLNTPQILQYTPIDYDKSLLSEELRALEAEIDDERSALLHVTSSNKQATITLNYPHRRAGTLPLNNRLQGIFPSGQQTHRTYVKLIDGQDGDVFDGWVVRKDRYVFGLAPFYRKHQIPVGAYIQVERGENAGEFVINYESYRPRTEWIRLIVPKNNQITFENHKRSIGADYDDLMILGVDDLAELDALQQFYHDQKRPLATIMRALIPSLGKLTPQGTVHAKTLYSAVNAVRRCPPGPIFATLVANPDFQDLGGYYWKIADL